MYVGLDFGTSEIKALLMDEHGLPWDAAWAIVQPVLDADEHPIEYAPGGWGPPEADRLVEDVGGWNTPA